MEILLTLYLPSAVVRGGVVEVSDGDYNCKWRVLVALHIYQGPLSPSLSPSVWSINRNKVVNVKRKRERNTAWTIQSCTCPPLLWLFKDKVLASLSLSLSRILFPCSVSFAFLGLIAFIGRSACRHQRCPHLFKDGTVMIEDLVFRLYTCILNHRGIDREANDAYGSSATQHWWDNYLVGERVDKVMSRLFRYWKWRASSLFRSVLDGKVFEDMCDKNLITSLTKSDRESATHRPPTIRAVTQWWRWMSNVFWTIRTSRDFVQFSFSLTGHVKLATVIVKIGADKKEQIRLHLSLSISSEWCKNVVPLFRDIHRE